jgi:hypothetical protein
LELEGADADSQCSAPGLAAAGGGSNGSVALTSLTGEGCVLEDAKIIAPPAGLPAGTDLPYGVLDFTLTGCSAGGSATLMFSYSSSIEGYAFWKHIQGEWMTMPSVVMAGNTATVTIEDNGPYDADSSPGVIRDPSGPGTVPGGGPPPTPIPALSPLALLVLLGLLGALGWRGVRLRAGNG